MCDVKYSHSLSVFRNDSSGFLPIMNCTRTRLLGNMVSKRTKVTMSKGKYLPHYYFGDRRLQKKREKKKMWYLCWTVLVNGEHAQRRSS